MHLPEFVHWCSIRYSFDKRVILSPNQTKTLCIVSADALAKVLCFPDLPTLQFLDEEALPSSYQALKPMERSNLLAQNLKEGPPIPTNPHPYVIVDFSDKSKEAIALICIISGYDDDKFVIEIILGFLSLLTPSTGVMPPIFDLCHHLAEKIHNQLAEYLALERFRYPSMLFYMFLYQNFQHFKGLEMKLRD